MAGATGGEPPDPGDPGGSAENRVDEMEIVENSQVGGAGTQRDSLSVVGKNFERMVRNRYQVTDGGPFFIYVEHKQLNVGNLHPMSIGRILEPLIEFDQCINEITAVGRNRVKLIVNNALQANKIVQSEVFPANKLVAYIPSHCIEKKGVVRMVDTSFSDDEILKRIKSDVKVIGMQRMT